MALRLGEPAPVFAREVMQSGNASLKRSIEEVVRSIRFGISDVEYARLARGWAGQVLIAAGKPKGVRAQTQAILDAARGQTMYVADPVHMEWIQTAVRTLCLKPGQCNPIGDCDDLCVVIATVCILIGIRTQLVEQHWENADQDHILDAVQDESGQWLKVDPSTDWPVGRAATADREIWIDPMQDVTPQLVALGRLRVLHETRYGKHWVSEDAGASWHEVSSLGAVATAWQSQGNTLVAGLRYQIVVHAPATEPGILSNPPWTADDTQKALGSVLLVESVSVGAVTQPGVGNFTDWAVVGVARANTTLTDDVPPGIQYIQVYLQIPQPSSGPTPITPTSIVPAPQTEMSPGAKLAIASAIALAAGAAGYGIYQASRHRRRRLAYR